MNHHVRKNFFGIIALREADQIAGVCLFNAGDVSVQIDLYSDLSRIVHQPINQLSFKSGQGTRVVVKDSDFSTGPNCNVSKK